MSLFMSNKGVPTADDYVWTQSYDSRPSFTLCPFNPLVTYGTYYIAMLNLLGQTRNSWRLRVNIVNSPSCPVSLPPPPNDDSNWVRDGSPVFLTIPAFQTRYFKFYHEFSSPTERNCFPLTASVYSTEGRSNADLYVSKTYAFPTRGLPYDFKSASPTDDPLGVVICTPNTSITLYFGIYNRRSTTGKFLFVVTGQPRTELIPLSEDGYAQSQTSLSFGSVPQLTCDRQTFTCRSPPYENCDLDDSLCCYLFGPLPPTLDASPLIPWNSQDTSLPIIRRIPWNDPTPLIPGRLSWFLYLGRSNSTSGAQFVFADPATCTVNLGSSIVSSTGELVTGNIKFSKKAASCESSQYRAKILEISDLVDSMYETTDFYELSLIHLQLNILSMSDSVLGCSYLIESLTETTSVSRQLPSSITCFSVSGTAAWGADPCCNSTLALTTCCAPRISTLELSTVTDANTGNVNSLCKNADCALRALETYISSFNSINNLVSGCSTEFQRSSSLIKLEELNSIVPFCRESVLGSDLLGSVCETDEQCLEGFSCNLYTRRCNHTTEEVIRCVYDAFEPAVLRSYFNNLNFTDLRVNESNFQYVVEQTAFSDQCVGEGALQYRSAFEYRNLDASCVDSCTGVEPICFETTCQIPPQCIGSLSGGCNRFWAALEADLNGCSDHRDCNWMNCPASLSTYACESMCVNGSLSAYTCVNCQSGSKCYQVDGFNQTRCDDGLCNLNPDFSSAECLSSGVCDISCASCLTESGCESAGVCSDVAVLGPYITSGGGVCLTPFIYNVEGVSCEPTLQIVVSGCVNTSVLTEAECLDIHGAWNVLADSPESCAAHGYGCRSLLTNKQIPVNQTECEECPTNEAFPYYTWKQGKWTAGRVQPLKWVERALEAPTRIERDLDYTKFSEDIQTAIADTFTFAFITEALCRYTTTYTVSESLVCDCSGTGDSQCFGSITNQQVGAGRACPGIESIINTRVAQIEIFNDTYPVDAPCQLIGLYSTSASEYELDESNSLSSAIFQSSPTNSFWVVQSTESTAVIGQIVSGAVNVTLGNIPIQTYPYLCIYVETDIGIANIATVWSLATLRDGTVIAFPPSDTVNYTGNAVCDYIPGPDVYFATKLVANYQKAQLQSRSIRAQSRAGAVFYFLTAAFAVLQAVVLIGNWDSEKIVHLKIAFVVIVFVNCLVRGIFLVIPPASFQRLESIEFIIFELPSFLFFTVYLSIVYLWVDVVLKASSWGRKRGFLGDAETLARNVFVGLNVMMYLIFIIFMFLISIIPALQKPSACFLGNQNNTFKNSSFYKVKLAYWIIVAAICILVSLGFIVGASSLLKIVLGIEKTGVNKHAQGKANARRMNKLLLITVVAGICTIFLMIRSALFLYAAVTSKPINVMVFVLLEVIPSVGLLYYLRPYWFSSLFRSTRGSSSAGSKDGSVSSAAASKDASKEKSISSK